jgi:hypothetical protein
MSLQQRDTISYNGMLYALDCDILRPYFNRYPDRKPIKIGFNSSLLRGYFCELSIVQNQILVNDIRIYVGWDEYTKAMVSISVMKSALGSNSLCDWFSGQLLLFSVENTNEHNLEYLCIQVANGIVKSIQTISQQAYHDYGNHAYDYG